MFIKLQKSKVSSKVYVHLVEGFRDDRGYPRQRVISNYGEFSALEAQEPGFLEKLKAEAKESSAAIKKAMTLEIDCLRQRNIGEHPLNYGHFFLEGIYRRLGLHTFLRKKAKFNTAYALSDIVELLVYARIISPASKCTTFESKDGYLRKFNFKIHDVYRTLRELNSLADDICLHVHKQVTKRYRCDAHLVFYDVTNYYFECDKEDGFRRRGASKEHRREPIVQMGLLIDDGGIPIAYRLFEGNTHDAKTLMPVLEELKHRYGFSRIVVVADKGLNSKDNTDYINSVHNGYIVSQKVRGHVAPEISAHIKDKSGWTFLDSGEFAFKSFLRKRQGANGHNFEEKVVCFWSADYARREAYKRGELVPAVESLVAHPARYEAINDYGRKRYVKEIFVTEHGEMAKKKLVFDEERFKADAELDGFYCIITSEPDMADLKIIDCYRGLSRIEESFRVIKSDLEGRPVYVWTRSHINAHFLICFLALVILRILQTKVNYSLSAEVIKEALSTATCTPLEKQYFIIEETILYH